ncbi:MAG: hypothetical protein QOJ25_174 [Solirubrobacteraceae bacterium]|nr:hypothetical protein [Solirubrobacteraceae bacterium]
MTPLKPAAVACAGLALAACGGSSPSGIEKPREARTEHTARTAPAAASAPTTAATAPAATSAPAATTTRPPRFIAILPAAHRQGLFDWIPAALVQGQPAIWISRVRAYGEPGFTITLLRFDQRLVTLHLHAGGQEPGGSGWRYGDAIGSGELRTVVAGFNSAFRESYGAGGFEAYGRAGWPLKRGKASVVIYRDGTADIGRWQDGVPAPGQPVAAVRQNLGLLINERHVPPSVDTCIKICWGDPLHEQPIVARSGLGITADGRLVWAAGHNLSVRALAEALLATGAVRAIELDINPAWVAGYLYAHPRHASTVTPIPLMPGQTGIPGQFLQPYFRDFFTVSANPRP